MTSQHPSQYPSQNQPEYGDIAEKVRRFQRTTQGQGPQSPGPEVYQQYQEVQSPGPEVYQQYPGAQPPRPRLPDVEVLEGDCSPPMQQQVIHQYDDGDVAPWVVHALTFLGSTLGTFGIRIFLYVALRSIGGPSTLISLILTVAILVQSIRTANAYDHAAQVATDPSDKAYQQNAMYMAKHLRQKALAQTAVAGVLMSQVLAGVIVLSNPAFQQYFATDNDKQPNTESAPPAEPAIPPPAAPAAPGDGFIAPAGQ